MSQVTESASAGKPWAELRTQWKMSRDKFASHVGLTPGAVWRIEVRGVFKAGELARLEAARDAGPTAHQKPAPPPQATSATVAVPTPTVSPQDDLTDPGDHAVTVSVSEKITDFLTPSKPVVTVTLSEPEVIGLPELSPFQRFLEDGIRRYSNSEVQTFKRCPLKWYLAYYLQLSPITESPVGVRAIGDRLHRALRWHYHPDPAQRRDVSDALELIIKIDHIELTQRYAPDVIPLGVETEFRQDADLERVMVAGYVEWVEETGADAELLVTGAEEYIEASLPTKIFDREIMIVGRLDARVKRVSDGARMFLDHKSVGNLTEPARLLALNEQMKMYITLETIIAQGTGERVDGAIFNMLRRCKRTARANPPFYSRVEVRHNPLSLDNFLTQLIATITRIEEVRAALDDGVNFRTLTFPVVTQDCTWSCDYLSLHSVMDDGSHWEAMAKAFFKKGDPSSYYVKNNVINPV